jgi:FixJ family two-component response regulator
LACHYPRIKPLIPTYNSGLHARRDIYSSMNKKNIRPTTPALVAVVDDDESVRTAIGSLFRSMGFRTELFGDGERFLGSPKLREFSCLILDVQMPGMDGLELQLRLAAASHPIPIIFVTAYADEKARARALRGGAVSFLAKPFSEDALLEAVQSAIDVETEN